MPPINLYSLPRTDWLDNPQVFKLHSRETKNVDLKTKSVDVGLIKEVFKSR